MNVSIIIPAFRAGATLPAVLEALAPVVRPGGPEVVVVESSGDGSANTTQERFPWARIYGLPRRVLPGRARNLGAALARGDVFAFLDADAVPQPGWLHGLLEKLGEDVDAVAGAVINGTPESVVGTAAWLLEFSDWLPGRRTPLQHAASCNLLVRRATFEAAGGFREDIFPGEDTILTFPIAASGRLGFAPAAQVRHHNRTTWREFLRHQRRLGRSFVHACRATPSPHRMFSRWPLAPLSGPVRVAPLAWRLAPQPREWVLAFRSCHAIVAGLIAWTVGVLREDG
jgi:GT2 family glycosyltransferase